MKNGYVIHLLPPCQPGRPYLRLRCGRPVHETKDTYNASIHEEEVTCTKCLGFINNPFRALRHYGRLTIIEDFVITLTHAGWHKWDISAVQESPGKWSIFAAQNKTLEYQVSRTAANTKEAAKHILCLLEKQLLNTF